MRTTIYRTIVIALFAWPGVAQAGDDVISGRAQVIAPDVIAIGRSLIVLHGIDAPEERQACIDSQGQPWNCAVAAAKTLLDLVGDFEVTCTRQAPDRRRRIYAECTVGNDNINEQMVLAGMAMAYRVESEAYVPAEEQAKAEGIGIWVGQMVPPWEYRLTGAGARQPPR